MSPGCNDMLAINPSAPFCEEENGAAWNVLHIHPRGGGAHAGPAWSHDM